MEKKRPTPNETYTDLEMQERKDQEELEELDRLYREELMQSKNPVDSTKMMAATMALQYIKSADHGLGAIRKPENITKLIETFYQFLNKKEDE